MKLLTSKQNALAHSPTVRISKMSRIGGTTIATFLLLLSTIVSLCANAIAQTPSVAINYFEAGVKENRNGKFDLAIEDFTMAIELSSHPWQGIGKRAAANSAAVSDELHLGYGLRAVSVLD